MYSHVPLTRVEFERLNVSSSTHTNASTDTIIDPASVFPVFTRRNLFDHMCHPSARHFQTLSFNTAPTRQPIRALPTFQHKGSKQSGVSSIYCDSKSVGVSELWQAIWTGEIFLLHRWFLYGCSRVSLPLRWSLHSSRGQILYTKKRRAHYIVTKHHF